jgi:hypothetical protein
MNNLSLSQINVGLGNEIDAIAAKIKELVSSANSFILLDAGVDALSTPTTITVSTITVSAVNTALASVQSQLSTIVTALKS